MNERNIKELPKPTTNCTVGPEPTRDMLVSPLLIAVPDPDLDYSKAKAIADSEAMAINPEAMLLAWFDRKEGMFSPRVE